MSNKDYSKTDALKIALNLERDGYDFYTAVAGKTKDPEVKEIFLRLAEEEERHLGLIRKIQDSLIDPVTYFISDEAMVEDYLRRVIEKRVFSKAEELDDIMNEITVEDAIMFAMQAEKDSRDFFLKMGELTRNHEGQVAFLQLAGYEERHLMELERLKGHIAKKEGEIV